MVEGADASRALIVLGAPRSGTTLVGNYLGSGPGVLNLGEYGGFHLAHNIARSTIGAIPGPFREAYLAGLAVHARGFAERLASEHRCGWYCDTTPWNILAAKALSEQIPDALFVLMLRHYSGAVQSLRRSFAGGFAWAGATWADSAELWARCYSVAGVLPRERTVVVGFEALTAEPGSTLSVLRTRLEEAGFDCSALDPMQLAISHAPPLGPGSRPTIGTLRNGEIELHPIRSFDPDRWSGDIHRMVWPVVCDVHRELQRQFAGLYLAPPRPSGLRVHDDVGGSVPFELGDDW